MASPLDKDFDKYAKSIVPWASKAKSLELATELANFCYNIVIEAYEDDQEVVNTINQLRSKLSSVLY